MEEIANQEVYKLKDISKEEQESLNQTIAKPLLALSSFEAPEEVSKVDMDLMLGFVENDDEILNSYTLLEDGNTYKINDISSIEKGKLNINLINGLLIKQMVSNEETANQIKNNMLENIPEAQRTVMENMSLAEIINMMPALMLVMNCITVLIVWVGGHNVNEGLMQVGDVMAFIQYTMQIVMAFLMISMVSIMLPRASVSAERINEVLETEPKIKDKDETKQFKVDKKGYVEFKDVSFHYPDADTEVVTDISFTAKPGETTALIGSTGSGKSTIVNLIPRFYDVTGGELLVDGVNVKDVSQKELRKRIGFVPQKGILFSGTANLMSSACPRAKECASRADGRNKIRAASLAASSSGLMIIASPSFSLR